MRGSRFWVWLVPGIVWMWSTGVAGGTPALRLLPLEGADGPHYLREVLHDRRVLVVVFYSFDCPMCTAYAPVLGELAARYAGRGVGFVGVVVGEEESAAEVARQARQLGLPFPVWVDRSGRVAAALEARVTPEVVVLDAQEQVRYRGRIDDRYAGRLQPRPQVQRHDLQEALEALLAGRPVPQPTTEALGCPLSRPTPRADGPVTFYRDVLPILQRHCQSCHRPGEVAPFSLLTYRQAVRWGQDIKSYTQARKMPPWKPVAGVDFVGDRRLSAQEIATLAAWVDGGMPAGDARQAPPPVRFTTDWQLGPPDCILTLPEDFELAAAGPDVYRCFVLPTHFDEDKYVSAVEVRPGNRRVVHHAVLFVDRHHAGRRVAARWQERSAATDPDRGPGYSLPLSFAFLPGFLPEGGLSGWAPGMLPRRLPPGVGYWLPRGADIVLQLHYHRSGRPEKDRTQVGLYFCREKNVQRLQGLTLPAAFAYIPAGAARYRVEGKAWLRQDCQIYALMPHMHLIGKEIRLTMTPPGGPKRTLIDIRDWDFNWQEDYFLRQPLSVPAGTCFEVEGIYDNSAANPFNPFQPPRTIWAGLETTNEMCVVFLGATSPQPGLIRYDLGLRLPGLGWLPKGVIPAWGL